MTNDFAVFRRMVRERLNAEAFDVSMRDAKTLLFHDSLQSALAHISLAKTPVNASGEPLTIVAGYIEKMIPNAVADCDDGVHLIAMNSALFVAIHEFAMFCFTQVDFFADIGDPTLETSPTPMDDSPPGLWLLEHTLGGGHVEVQHSQSMTPRGESRYAASIYLAMLMCRFVWLHEFQHCFNGHIRFVQASGAAMRLHEVAETMEMISVTSKADNQRWRERKCLEFDADQSAFWASCRIQMADRENIEGIAALPSALRLRLTLFGVYAMTWLFEEIQSFLNAHHGLTHPTPFLRLHHLFRIGASNLVPLEDDFPEINRKACEAFDAIAKAIPGSYRSHDLYSTMQDSATQDELSAYADLLEQLRPRFRAYSYSTE